MLVCNEHEKVESNQFKESKMEMSLLSEFRNDQFRNLLFRQLKHLCRVANEN